MFHHGYSSRDQGRISRLPMDLIRARELLMDLVSKDLRAQYRYAVMGFMWAVIEPLAMTLVLTVVFSFVLDLKMDRPGVDTEQPFAVLLLCAYLFWKFFSDSLSGGSRSLVDNRSLIDKVNFPREVIPLASIGFAFVNLCIGLVIFVIVHLLFGGSISATYLLLPVVFGIQLTLTVGLTLLLSSMNAFFRDVSYIVNVALVFGFYATPIFYTLATVQQIAGEKAMPWALALYQLNPMVGLVSSYRSVLVDNDLPSAALLAWPTFIAVSFLLIGVVVFRKNSGHFADYL